MGQEVKVKIIISVLQACGVPRDRVVTYLQPKGELSSGLVFGMASWQ